MESFSNLFRTSSFATLEQRGRQIININPQGLKRNIYNEKFITVKNHDKNKKLIYKNSTRKVGLCEIYKDLFPIEKNKSNLPQEKITNLSRISSKKFNLLLKTAKTNSEDWKVSKLSPQEWPSFLNVSLAQTEYKRLNPTKEGFYHSPSYLTEDLVKKLNSQTKKPLSLITPDIKGRILNPVKNGFAIGIGGFVAFCHQSEVTYGISMDRNKIYNFRVISAWIDHRKRFEIYVTMKGANKTILEETTIKKNNIKEKKPIFPKITKTPEILKLKTIK